MDVIKEVVEASCQLCDGSGNLDSHEVIDYTGKCPDCRGTGLRWSELSKVPRFTYRGGPFLVPDPTIEKIRQLCANAGYNRVEFVTGPLLRSYPENITCFLHLDGSQNDEETMVYGCSRIEYMGDSRVVKEPTMLEAACDALLKIGL